MSAGVLTQHQEGITPVERGYPRISHQYHWPRRREVSGGSRGGCERAVPAQPMHKLITLADKATRARAGTRCGSGRSARAGGAEGKTSRAHRSRGRGAIMAAHRASQLGSMPTAVPGGRICACAFVPRTAAIGPPRSYHGGAHGLSAGASSCTGVCVRSSHPQIWRLLCSILLLQRAFPVQLCVRGFWVVLGFRY